MGGADDNTSPRPNQDFLRVSPMPYAPCPLYKFFLSNYNSLSCHCAAGFGAATANFGAELHLKIFWEAIAVSTASFAHFGTNIASATVQRRILQHEIGTGLANLRAIQHQNYVRHLCVLSALLQAVSNGIQTDAVAIEAILNALLHFFIQSVELKVGAHSYFPHEYHFILEKLVGDFPLPNERL